MPKLNTAFLHIEPQLATRGPKAGQPKRHKEDASKYVIPSQIINANNGFLFAQAQGFRLNTSITVLLKCLRGPKGWRNGEDAAGQVRFQCTRLRQALQRWCNRHNIPFAMISVIENKQGPASHLHILLHLTEDQEPKNGHEDVTWHRNKLALTKFLDRYSKEDPATIAAQLAAVERRIREGDSSLEDSQGNAPTTLPIYVSPHHLPHMHGDHCARLKLAYMLKCMDPHTILGEKDGKRITAVDVYRRSFGDGISLDTSTDVYVRNRVSLSETLTISARAKAGWTETSDMMWLDRDHVFGKLKMRGIEVAKMASLVGISIDP